MRVSARRRMSFQSGALVSLVLSCAAVSFAQDLGAIARQERERKKEQPPRATYVYTNDDLARKHILVPEDQARMLTARNASTPPVTVAQTPAAVSAAPVPISAPPANVSAPPLAASNRSAVARAGAPQPTVLERVLEVVREQSARNHPQTRLATRSAKNAASSDTLPPSTSVKRIEQSAVVPRLASHPDFSRNQPRGVMPLREPVDLGIADVVSVERGDSLWKLARLYLGRGSRWREILALNPQILNPGVIHAGEWICVPSAGLQNAQQRTTPRARALVPASVAQGRAPNPSPSAPVTVQIASRQRFTGP
jgi:LysM domain